MKDLIKILGKFGEERGKLKEKNNKLSYEDIANCFAPCAEDILLKGYLLVNDEYIIDLGAIELYYHEEDGALKDHIMYHTNEHSSKSELCKTGYPFRKFKIEVQFFSCTFY